MDKQYKLVFIQRLRFVGGNISVSTSRPNGRGEARVLRSTERMRQRNLEETMARREGKPALIRAQEQQAKKVIALSVPRIEENKRNKPANTLNEGRSFGGLARRMHALHSFAGKFASAVGIGILSAGLVLSSCAVKIYKGKPSAVEPIKPDDLFGFIKEKTSLEEAINLLKEKKIDSSECTILHEQNPHYKPITGLLVISKNVKTIFLFEEDKYTLVIDFNALEDIEISKAHNWTAILFHEAIFVTAEDFFAVRKDGTRYPVLLQCHFNLIYSKVVKEDLFVVDFINLTRIIESEDGFKNPSFVDSPILIRVRNSLENFLLHAQNANGNKWENVHLFTSAGDYLTSIDARTVFEAPPGEYMHIDDGNIFATQRAWWIEDIITELKTIKITPETKKYYDAIVDYANERSYVMDDAELNKLWWFIATSKVIALYDENGKRQYDDEHILIRITPEHPDYLRSLFYELRNFSKYQLKSNDN